MKAVSIFTYACMLTFTTWLMPITQAANYVANLSRDQVSPAPTGNTPASASATATFELVEVAANEYALEYQITIVGLDTADFRPNATARDTPNLTADDLTAIHMHDIPSVGNNRGTPHVMNILGNPLGLTGTEDDLSVLSFDPDSLTTVFTGTWDAADVDQTATLPMVGPRTKPVGDFLDHLNGQQIDGRQIFMMIHTFGDGQGAIGGRLLAVPEPTSLALVSLAVLICYVRTRQ